MTIIHLNLMDHTAYDWRNLTLARPGEVRVRPGFREVVSLSAGTRFVGGKSVKVPSSGKLWHYLVAENSTPGSSSIAYVYVYDENFALVQTLRVEGARPPIPQVSFACMGRDMLITGPRMPPVKAVLGGYLEVATPVESLNSIRQALDIPRGPAVAWAGRMVVAADNGIYFSDPFAPFTFISSNIAPVPSASPVFGLHLGAEGALIAVSESGAWAMPEDAAASYQVTKDLSPLDATPVFDYAQSTHTRQRVYGVSRRGLGQIFPSGAEVDANELELSRALGARIASADFRSSARLVSTDEGLVMSHGGAVFRLDLASGSHSWWTSPLDAELEVVAILRDVNGEEMWLTRSGVWKLLGNFDGGDTYDTENGTAVKGYFAGTLMNAPDATFSVVETRLKTDGDTSAHHTINGRTASVAVPQNGTVSDGAPAWEDTDQLISPRLEQTTSATPALAGEANEVSFELGAAGPHARVLPIAMVDLAGTERMHDS